MLDVRRREFMTLLGGAAALRGRSRRAHSQSATCHALGCCWPIQTTKACKHASKASGRALSALGGLMGAICEWYTDSAKASQIDFSHSRRNWWRCALT